MASDSSERIGKPSTPHPSSNNNRFSTLSSTSTASTKSSRLGNPSTIFHKAISLLKSTASKIHQKTKSKPNNKNKNQNKRLSRGLKIQEPQAKKSENGEDLWDIITTRERDRVTKPALSPPRLAPSTSTSSPNLPPPITIAGEPQETIKTTTIFRSKKKNEEGAVVIKSPLLGSENEEGDGAAGFGQLISRRRRRHGRKLHGRKKTSSVSTSASSSSSSSESDTDSGFGGCSSSSQTSLSSSNPSNQPPPPLPSLQLPNNNNHNHNIELSHHNLARLSSYARKFERSLMHQEFLIRNLNANLQTLFGRKEWSVERHRGLSRPEKNLLVREVWKVREGVGRVVLRRGVVWVGCFEGVRNLQVVLGGEEGGGGGEGGGMRDWNAVRVGLEGLKRGVEEMGRLDAVVGRMVEGALERNGRIFGGVGERVGMVRVRGFVGGRLDLLAQVRGRGGRLVEGGLGMFAGDRAEEAGV